MLGNHSQPLREVGLRKSSGSEVFHDSDDLGFFGLDGEPIEPEEDVDGKEGHPFVAVQEGMITRQPMTEGGGQLEQVRAGFVMEALAGAGQGGFEKRLVS